MAQVKKLTRKEKVAQGPKNEAEKGNRKKRMAAELKEMRSTVVEAKLWGVPTSPRKMRLVADQVRGMEVTKALAVLKLSPRSAARPLHKLLKSALTNWEQKLGSEPEDTKIGTITVNGGSVLKRVLPAPQGRAYQIRKRSNHVRIVLENINEVEA